MDEDKQIPNNFSGVWKDIESWFRLSLPTGIYYIYFMQL